MRGESVVWVDLRSEALSCGLLEGTEGISKRVGRVCCGSDRGVRTSFGWRTLPLTKILSMFIVPLLCSQSSQSAYNAFLTLSWSGEYNSNGQ